MEGETFLAQTSVWRRIGGRIASMDVRSFLDSLEPNRPLTGTDERYAERPTGAGKELARLAEFEQRIVVVGPPGVGKSTELMRAAIALQSRAIAVLTPLDRLMDMRRAEPDLVFEVCRKRLADIVERVLRIDVERWPPDLAAEPRRPLEDPLDRLLDLIRRAAQHSRQKHVVFLVDGLEKCDEEQSRAVLMALSRVAGEAVVIVTAPLALVTGPTAFQVLEEYRLFSIGPLPRSQAGPFLREVLARRAEAPPGLEQILDSAIELSGGVPRTFLSLIKSTVINTALAGRDRVTEEDFRDSVAHHRDSYHRVLAQGDKDRLNTAKDINQIPTDVLARMLSHGVLLERHEHGQQGLDVHPLLRVRQAA
jgi:hypothetical protein